MKKLLSIIILGLFFIVTGCEKDSLFDTTVDNDTKVSVRASDLEIEDMINGGVAWLLTTQQPEGYFTNPSNPNWRPERVARTGMTIVKLCDRSIELGHADPLSGPYAEEIQAGLDYILSQERVYVGVEGKAYNELGNEHHENYNTAFALMAFVATRDYGAYGGYAQAAADYFSYSQADNGAWGYNALENAGWQDNSNTGYVALALVAARNFGCDVPSEVSDKMGHQTTPENWIDFIQDDASGGSQYSPQYWKPWINMLKTGNLLFEMAFVGDKASDLRVQNAIGYLETHWNDPNRDPGFRPHNYQAMYTMMKGFAALGIDEINVGGPVDWYDEFADIILNTKQGVPGNYYWLGDGNWTDEHTATIFALLTLEKVVELPRVEVYLDIKPTSCPNPFNMKAKGVLPVAILGSPDCDVTNIDVSSLTLSGVAPIRSNIEDVAAPLYDPTEECECATAGPDGYMDLTLKFNRQEIAAALGDVSDGDIIPLTINGELFSGLELTGTDCIVIKKKGKK